MKNFFIGLIVVEFIVFIYFLIYYFYNEQIGFIPFVFGPISIYLCGFIGAKLNSLMLSKNKSIILKYSAIFFFSIVTLFEIFKDINIINADTLFVVISLIFNWDEDDMSERKEEYSYTSKSCNVYYLINFIVLFLVYVCVAMLFNRKTAEGNILLSIFIYGISLTILYWVLFLIYNFLFKASKIMTIIKIFFIFVCVFASYYFRSAFLEFNHQILLVLNLFAVISVTIQNLLLSRTNSRSKKCIQN